MAKLSSHKKEILHERIARFVAAMLLFFVSRLLTAAFLENTLDPISFRVLSSAMRPAPPITSIPVRVLDLSPALQGIPENHSTPSALLISVLDAVAKASRKPAVVGLDINLGGKPLFSDDDSTTPTAFVNSSEHLKTLRYIDETASGSFPVVFGVDALVSSPEVLGFPSNPSPIPQPELARLTQLEATLLTGNDASKMLIQSRFGGDRIISLGALASQLARQKEDPSPLSLQSFVVSHQEPAQNGKPFQERFVDYSLLKHWPDLVFKVNGGEPVIDQAKLENFLAGAPNTYVLLIGTARSEVMDDLFVADDIPSQESGTSSSVYPGIAQHAALVYTLLQHPLSRLAGPASLILDIASSLLIWLLLEFHHRKSQQKKLQVLEPQETKKGHPFRWLFELAYCAAPVTLGSLTAAALILGSRLSFFAGLSLIVLCGFGSLAIGIRYLWLTKPTPIDNNLAFLFSLSQRTILFRFFTLCLPILLAVILSSIGLFWTGFIAVCLFVLIDGYVEPVIEVVIVDLYNRVSSALKVKTYRVGVEKVD